MRDSSIDKLFLVIIALVFNIKNRSKKFGDVQDKKQKHIVNPLLCQFVLYEQGKNGQELTILLTVIDKLKFKLFCFCHNVT